MVGTKILVVDDEAAICQMLRPYLESEGYEVKTAADGAEVKVEGGEVVLDLKPYDFHIVILK